MAINNSSVLRQGAGVGDPDSFAYSVAPRLDSTGKVLSSLMDCLMAKIRIEAPKSEKKIPGAAFASCSFDLLYSAFRLAFPETPLMNRKYPSVMESIPAITIKSLSHPLKMTLASIIH